ncbi:hypothetical protein ACFQY4_11590 [Catellatospora bangladeshensis]|uniref:hypothetical protein n=1 Tax=Catellatospora bangladeshensis TaxID=310355 RepID=UPI00360B16FF
MPQRTAGPLALAVDIGGTKMAAGLVTADGTVLAADRIATPARHPDRTPRPRCGRACAPCSNA